MNIVINLGLTPHYVLVLLVNLAVAFLLLLSLKTLAGGLANVSVTSELAERDNPAFGISLAGVAVAVTLMMTGVMSGDASENLVAEVGLVTSYGVLGIVLMFLTRLVFDRFLLPSISIKSEIKKGNIAAAILEASNVVAAGIVVRAAMIWIDDANLAQCGGVIGVYLLSQIIMSLSAKYAIWAHDRRSKQRLDKNIEDGNVALAFSFAGYRLAVALAITAVSGLVPYVTGDFFALALTWLVVSAVMTVLVTILVKIADRLILPRVDLNDEITGQSNLAIGSLQFAINVSVGLIIVALS